MSSAHVVTSATCLDTFGKPCEDMSGEAAIVTATFKDQGPFNLIFQWKDKQLVVRLPCGCSTWEAKVMLSYDAIFMSPSGRMHSCNGPAKCRTWPLFSLCLPLSVPFPHPVLNRCCKSRSSYNDVELQGDYSLFEDVKLERNPAYSGVTPSQAQTEARRYEKSVAIGGVTSDSVAMEENPAYQPAEPPQYEYVEGVTSRPDVQTKENPAYQSVDTTESQTEEPEYL